MKQTVNNTTINIVGALEIEPGKTYVIETDHYLNSTQRFKLLEMLYSNCKLKGTRFLILDGGMKVARADV